MKNISFEEWEAEQMKDWRFRLSCLIYEPAYQWHRFRRWLRLRTSRRYRRKVEEWAKAYDLEAIVYTKAELDALYGDSYFEAMEDA